MTFILFLELENLLHTAKKSNLAILFGKAVLKYEILKIADSDTYGMP